MKDDSTKYQIDFYNINTAETTTEELVVIEGVHPENHNITWSCDFTFKGERIIIKQEYYLSMLMYRIREKIEPQGYRALVICSELDAHHSGMQADMSNGSIIYKLESQEKEGSLKSFPVFGKSSIEKVVTIGEQKKFQKEFLDRPKPIRKKPLPWYKRFFN